MSVSPLVQGSLMVAKKLGLPYLCLLLGRSKIYAKHSMGLIHHESHYDHQKSLNNFFYQIGISCLNLELCSGP